MHTSHGGSETQTATRTTNYRVWSAREQQQSRREETRREELASPQRHCLLAVSRAEQRAPAAPLTQTTSKSAQLAQRGREREGETGRGGAVSYSPTESGVWEELYDLLLKLLSFSEAAIKTTSAVG